MSTKRYPEEFKIEAVKQVTERGHTVADVSSRLGVSAHSLYKWINEAKLTCPLQPYQSVGERSKGLQVN